MMKKTHWTVNNVIRRGETGSRFSRYEPIETIGDDDDDDERSGFSYDFKWPPAKQDDDDIVPILVSISIGFVQIDYANGIRYSEYYSPGEINKYVEWISPDNLLCNPYGPASICIKLFFGQGITQGMTDEIESLEYILDQRRSTREEVKTQYELVHLDDVEDDNSKGRLLADDRTIANKDFWFDWMKQFEEERNIQDIIVEFSKRSTYKPRKPNDAAGE